MSGRKASCRPQLTQLWFSKKTRWSQWSQWKIRIAATIVTETRGFCRTPDPRAPSWRRIDSHHAPMTTSSLPSDPGSPTGAAPTRARRPRWVTALVVLGFLAALGAARQWTTRRLSAARDAGAAAAERAAPNLYTVVARLHNRHGATFASRAAQVIAE